jgi:hypothetical protein
VFVTSKVAVTFGSVNVSVLAQVPPDESVPVSEYVAAEAAWGWMAPIPMKRRVATTTK